MKIDKVLNNNVVVALDRNGTETVLMGRGLAFGRHAGDPVPAEKVEKRFTLHSDQLSSRFQQLLTSIPLSDFLMSERIINHAKLILGKELSDSIYVTLPDHISAAVQRYQEGLILPNPLLWDIRQFYKDEYQIGLSVYAYLIKNSGILFALLISLLLAGIALWNRRQGRPPARRDWRCIAGVCLAPVAVLYVWNRHTTMVFENASATKHAMRPGQLLSTFAEKTAEELTTTISAFFSALPSISVLSLLCLAVMAICLYVAGKRRRALHLPTLAALGACAAVYVAYLAGLLLMYLFSMSHGEATGLSALSRYMETIDLWLIYMTAGVWLNTLAIHPPQTGKARICLAAATAACVGALLVFNGFPNSSVLHHHQLYSQSDRAKIERAIQEHAIPSGERYVLASTLDGGMAYYIFQYLLDPAFLSLNLEDWHQADAILIYDPKPLELVYIEETVLPSGEAPVIYDLR